MVIRATLILFYFFLKRLAQSDFVVPKCEKKYMGSVDSCMPLCYEDILQAITPLTGS